MYHQASNNSRVFYQDPLVTEAMGTPGYLYEGWASTKKTNDVNHHPPLVETPWLDQALVTPWYVPLTYLFWLTGTWTSFLAFGVGFGLWQAFEYCVHRFVYHGRWLARDTWFDIPWVRAAHCLAHGHHHRDPGDPLRIVHSPLLVVPLGFVVSRLLPPGIFLGFVWGYILFELCHYALHHLVAHPGMPWPFCSVLWAEMRKHHLAHHSYKNATHQTQPGTSHNFGVTTSVGDQLCSTQFIPTQ